MKNDCKCDGVENHVFTCAWCGRQWTVVSDEPLDCFFLGLCHGCIATHRLTADQVRQALSGLIREIIGTTKEKNHANG